LNKQTDYLLGQHSRREMKKLLICYSSPRQKKLCTSLSGISRTVVQFQKSFSGDAKPYEVITGDGNNDASGRPLAKGALMTQTLLESKFWLKVKVNLRYINVRTHFRLQVHM
jgi:hypothetical protein